MLAEISSYVIAFVVFLIIPIPSSLLSVMLVPLLKRVKWVAPLSNLIINAVGVYIGVLIASWLISEIGNTPSWLMFLFPGYYMVQNDVGRINRVKAGKSNVQMMLEANDEPESYDQSHDLWCERGNILGDVIGWCAGTIITLQSASFL